MTSTSDVVVWCYLARKVWFAFEPCVSNFIEKNHCPNSNKLTFDIGFGSASSLKSSEIELSLTSRVVRDKYSGKQREIRRGVYPPDSVHAKSAVWEFEGDSVNHWVAFDIGTTQLIENASTVKIKTVLNLTTFNELPYTIDIRKKIQTNVKTKKQRKIRRFSHKEPYISDVFTSSLGASNSPGERKISADNSTSAKSCGVEGACGESERPRRMSLPKCKHVDIPRLGSYISTSTTDPLYEFTKEVATDDFKDDEECCICFDKLGEESGFGEGMPESRDTVMLLKCQHIFHKLCLMELYKRNEKDGFLQCPSCKCLHGDKVGDCPAGRMEWEILDDLSLSGYEDCHTIHVTYIIRSGIQVQGHPNPGKPFTARGFPRSGFLPDSNKGRKVLKLLMEAFRRRLMFTVGSSTTTGEVDTVTWNDIHHKTETVNHRGHGYPDPNYLDNVLLELAAHGVSESEDCLEED